MKHQNESLSYSTDNVLSSRWYLCFSTSTCDGVFAVKQNNSENTSCDGVTSVSVIGISLKTTVKTETGVNSYSADK